MNSSTNFTFSSRFANNAVFVIDLLGPNTMQTARRLSEDLDPLKMPDGSPYCHYNKVSSVVELKALLTWIETHCHQGLRPIIHFEAHGSQNDGLQIGASSEWISWAEISEQLLSINNITKNNLGVVMASCFGFYAISSITIKRPAPFYFLIGSTTEVSAGYIQENMVGFYRELFDQRSLDDVMAHVESQFQQFHSEKFFCITFGKYLKQKCVGSEASRRVENMISNVFESGVPRSRENLRELRRSAKAFVKSSERQKDAFYRQARNFLHGKVPMDFDAFERFVKRADA
jgi:hypothetical protein